MIEFTCAESVAFNRKIFPIEASTTFERDCVHWEDFLPFCTMETIFLTSCFAFQGTYRQLKRGLLIFAPKYGKRFEKNRSGWIVIFPTVTFAVPTITFAVPTITFTVRPYIQYCKRMINALFSLHECAVWTGPSHSAYAIEQPSLCLFFFFLFFFFFFL